MTEILVNDGTILNDHLKIIHQVAWMLHSTSGYDLEDLFSEGCLQYLLRRGKFNPEFDTKATTFIYNAVKNALINYMEKLPHFIFTDSEVLLHKLTQTFIGTSCDNHRVREKFLYNAY